MLPGFRCSRLLHACPFRLSRPVGRRRAYLSSRNQPVPTCVIAAHACPCPHKPRYAAPVTSGQASILEFYQWIAGQKSDSVGGCAAGSPAPCRRWPSRAATSGTGPTAPDSSTTAITCHRPARAMHAGSTRVIPPLRGNHPAACGAVKGHDCSVSRCAASAGAGKQRHSGASRRAPAPRSARSAGKPGHAGMQRGTASKARNSAITCARIAGSERPAAGAV